MSVKTTRSLGTYQVNLRLKYHRGGILSAFKTDTLKTLILLPMLFFSHPSIAQLDDVTWDNLPLVEKTFALLELGKKKGQTEEVKRLWHRVELKNKYYMATQLAAMMMGRAARSTAIHPNYPTDYRELFLTSTKTILSLAEKRKIEINIYKTGESEHCPQRYDEHTTEMADVRALSVYWRTNWKGVVLEAEIRGCSHTENFLFHDLAVLIIHEFAHASNVDISPELLDNGDFHEDIKDGRECGATLFSYLAIYSTPFRKILEQKSYLNKCPAVNTAFKDLFTYFQ